ncbi:MAG: glutamate formimidoyltransferase [Chloroflexi bacterium]|nr:glutamate formimidoyltransferase [Chloroflexota bacterium]
MSQAIVECIPNFSEGRRSEVVEAIVSAITTVKGVTLLDHSSDPDHNRTVVTFVGGPDAIEKAAFEGISKAAELIDMDEHEGEHPRLGATDVVPFVPISGVSMEDCVAMAQRLGERVGKELSIPVYLYEEAATRPERQNLAKVRKGQYEALKEELGSRPERAPDYGPSTVGKAGGTVIGARAPLVAYNVFLNTKDVSIAKEIAKAVRHSSGGLAYVKGAGFEVDGWAQVSMNLTNYRKTPVFRVVELIRREAERYGVGIMKSELIGLIPQEAMLDAAQWYLQLDDFEPDQVLEVRMGFEASDGEDFIEELASSEPVPGGGSAAAQSGAMGAALVAMMGRVTVGKKKYADVEADMQAIVEKADGLRSDLSAAINADAAAFTAVMDAFRLPKDSEEEKAARSQAIQAATLKAAEVPLDTARKCLEVIELAAEAVEKGNTNAVTDAGSGALMARAGLTASGLNVRINLTSLKDKDTAEEMLAALESLEKRSDELIARVNNTMQDRGGFQL